MQVNETSADYIMQDVQMEGDEEEVFASTLAGVVIPSVTGSLSFVSSFFIMITIFRSKQNTQYHRILFCLSFWDSLVSFCIALSTIPMPKDVVYDYQGPSYGNTGTCELQAFLIFLGWGYVCNSNVLLNIYYLCTIRYNVSEEKFRKIAEPIFVIFSSASSLVMPFYFLSRDAFNPTPVDTFCAVDVYPRQCLEDSSVECIHGKAEDWDETLKFYDMYPIAGIGINFIVLILSMILVVHTVCSPHIEKAGGITQRQKTVIAVQAFMYIVACFLAWVFTVASFFVDETKTVATLKYVFTPLQGFFNLLIFVFQKLYTCTNSETGGDLTLLSTLRLFIFSPHLLVDKTFVINLNFVEDFQKNKSKSRHDTNPKLSLEETPKEDSSKEEPVHNSITDSKERLYRDLEESAAPSQSKAMDHVDLSSVDESEDKGRTKKLQQHTFRYYTRPDMKRDSDKKPSPQQEVDGARSSMTDSLARLFLLRSNMDTTTNDDTPGESQIQKSPPNEKFFDDAGIMIKRRESISNESIMSKDLSIQESSHFSSRNDSYLMSYESSNGEVISTDSTIVTGVGSRAYSKKSKVSWRSR